MENMKYRYIYEYEFYRGTSAAETARRIDEGTALVSRPETNAENKELKAIVEANSSQNTSKIAAGVGESDETVLIHLKQIGKVKKLERWQLQIMKKELVANNRDWSITLGYCCFTTTQDHTAHTDHTAQQKNTKLDELQLKCLRHPPCSPDLAPTDYHFFGNLDNFLYGKKSRYGSPNRLQIVY
ncbi:histone-lysine N-methyltransferase SETMAR-like [Vanessa tameamea]|uniref:Histone-lysine N-methyltransferase SETMAR-like n=1 Tax=Vanessa tameamea TaxID=334116 RepID=A0ABM4AP62_VANTA